MSRIGKKAVAVPGGVTVTIEGQTVSVNGPKGQLAWTVAEEIEVRQEGAELVLSKRVENTRAQAMWGLSRTLVANMVQGVTQGYEETLELVGLEGKGDRLPEELSGGEQQRVAIARAFVNRPTILIADEPTGNLDPTTSVGIMRLLDQINRADTTVIMATHDATIVDQMRKRVIELADGELVRDQSKGVYGYQ